jgi:uncharacterized membrane protein
MEAGARQFDPRTPEERSERETEFARIVAFTDGVFAIAITLLVLTIEVPQGSKDLLADLRHQLPDLIAYALSFAVIGRFWLLHHRFFAHLERFDSRLMTLNLTYLGLIVLVPFTSELLGDYGDDVEAPVIYAVVLAAAALVNWSMVRYAIRGRLVNPESRVAVAGSGELTGLAIPGIFLISIPLAFISPYLAEISWALLFLVRSTLARRRS